MTHSIDAKVINKSGTNTNYIVDTGKIFAYFFTVILIYLSGVPGFNNEYLILTMFVLSLIVFVKKDLKLDNEILYIMLILAVMTFFQVLEFAYFPLWTISGTFVRFAFAYTAIKVIGHNFPIYYVRIIYLLTIISFIFYFPSILIPGFIDFLSQIADFIGTAGTSPFARGENIIIYSATRHLQFGLFRNSGPFGEPGMFSVYLVSALILNTIVKKRLNEKINIVFILALLTTFSTAGYLALLLYLIAYLALGSFKKPYIFLILPFLIYGSWYIYFNVDFMGDKIDTQFQAYERGVVYAGRIGSTYNDIESILEYPLFGRGRHSETRFDDYVESTELQVLRRYHRTNGVTDFIVKYGLIFSLIYFYYMYKSLLILCKSYNYSKLFALMSLFLILVVGFSQVIFQHFVLIGLIFLHVNYKQIDTTNFNGKIVKS